MKTSISDISDLIYYSVTDRKGSEVRNGAFDPRDAASLFSFVALCNRMWDSGCTVTTDMVKHIALRERREDESYVMGELL